MGKSRLALIFRLLFVLVSRGFTHFSVDKKLYGLFLCTAAEMTRYYVALMASVLTSSGIFGKCKRGCGKWSGVTYSGSFGKKSQGAPSKSLCSTKCGVFV